MTISGSPTQLMSFRFELITQCGRYNPIRTDYRIDPTPAPPAVSHIFRDADRNWAGNIFYNGTKGYNNTVCVNPNVTVGDVASQTTLDLYACFNDLGEGFVGGTLEWEFNDINNTSPVSPTLSTTPLTNAYGNETGIRVRFHPSVVASTRTGTYIQVRARSRGTCSPTTFSNWYSQNLYIVNSSVISQTNIDPDLPELDQPVALARDIRGGCGDWNTGTIPTCEVQDVNLVGVQRTQFFTSAKTGDNNFGELEWELTDPNAGSIDPWGVVTWTPGYHGTLKVRVRPKSCDDNVSNSDWVESDQIIINEVVERIPSITRLNLPTCPIPVTGNYTSTLNSDLAVDWYIEAPSGQTTSNFIRQNTGVTSYTGAQYLNQQFYEIESNVVSNGLVLPWSNTASGVVNLKAVPIGCSGQETQWVRIVSIVIPGNPRLQVATTSQGSPVLTICENETDIQNVLYDIIGRSVTGITVIDTASPTSVYANLLDIDFIQKSQVETVTIGFRNGANIIDINNEGTTRWLVININEKDYKVEAQLGESNDSVGSKFATMINQDSNLSANYDNATNNLEIVSNPGYYFTLYTSWVDNERPDIIQLEKFKKLIFMDNQVFLK